MQRESFARVRVSDIRRWQVLRSLQSLENYAVAATVGRGCPKTHSACAREVSQDGCELKLLLVCWLFFLNIN